MSGRRLQIFRHAHCLRYAVAILMILVAASPLPAAENRTQSSTKTYTVKWADTDELAPILEKIVGKNGKVFKLKNGSELIISTTKSLHTQIAEIIKEIDKPVPNVRIDVTMTDQGKSITSKADLSPSGKVVITKRGTSSHFKLKPNIEHQTTTKTSNTKQMLVVRSGMEASLKVGEEIPYAEWLFYYGRSNGYIDFDFKFTPKYIGASLVAEPTVIGQGPMIKIKLTPQITTLVGKTYRHFKYTKVSTTVTAYDGHPLSLGGLSKNSEVFKKLLTGYDRRGEVKSVNIVLTPHIQHIGNATANQLKKKAFR